MLRLLNIFTVCILLVFCAVAVPIHAEDSQSNWYIDECKDLQSNCAKYNNFQVDENFFSNYDHTVFRMSANKAVAIYDVNHAQKLEVEIFCNNSTFATLTEDGLQMGFKATDSLPNILSNVLRCRYQQSHDKVYVCHNNKNYSLQISPFSTLQLMEDKEIPLGEENPYYGINVEVSVDGTKYQSIDMQLNKEKINFENSLFQECYSCNLPSGISHVKLTMYGYRQLPGQGIGSLPEYPYLSRVKILQSNPSPSNSKTEPGETPSSKPEIEQPKPKDPQSNNQESNSTTNKNDTTQSHATKKPVCNGKADVKEKNDSEPRQRFVLKNRTEYMEDSNENSAIINNNCNFEKEDIKPKRIDDVHSNNNESQRANSDTKKSTNNNQLNEPSDIKEIESNLQSLYEEKAEKPSSTAVGLLISSVTIVTVLSILIFFKPHKKVDK